MFGQDIDEGLEKPGGDFSDHSVGGNKSDGHGYKGDNQTPAQVSQMFGQFLFLEIFHRV